MVWYSHLLKNLSQFVVIHTVKVFRVVNDAEIDYEVVLGTLNAEFQRIARRDEKAFLSDQCKEIEENDRIGKSWRRHWHPNPVILPG